MTAGKWSRARQAGTSAGRFAAALASLALLLALAAPAGAAPREPLYSFGPDGSEASTFAKFGERTQLGIEQAGRRLYVPDDSVPGVWGFDVSGSPPFALLAGFDPLAPSGVVRLHGLAVDSSGLASAGNLYPISAGANAAAYRFSPLGVELSPPGDLPTDGGNAAVDSAGRLWVEGLGGGVGGERLDEFGPGGGEPVESVPKRLLPAGLGGGLGGIAAGPGDQLLALSQDRRSLWRLDPTDAYTSGEPLVADLGGVACRAGMAYDARRHILYLVAPGCEAIAAYDGAGEPIEEFGQAAGASYVGLAVDEASGELFAADSPSASDAGKGQVTVFAAGPALAVLDLEAPDPLHNASATLHATVHPEGAAPTACRFQWVSGAAYLQSGFGDLSSGGEAQCEPPAGSIPGSGETEVSAAAEGLKPGTDYSYRLLAENADGHAGELGSFTTPAPPAVETTGAQLPSPSEAILGGRLNPERAATSYRFQYTTQAGFEADGWAGATQSAPAELEANELQTLLIDNDTRLHLGAEVTAVVAAGASAGEVRAALETLPSISPGDLSVSGQDPRYTLGFTGALADTDVAQVRTDEVPGDSFATKVQGGIAGDARISLLAAHITGLAPETTYRYRLVADNENEAGEVFGNEITLTTAPSAPPSHDPFPGPPESDRAYEQVSIADSGGNPVQFPTAFSAGGERAIYQLSGGAPISSSGTLISQLLAKRTESAPHEGGWEQENLVPRSIFAPEERDWLFYPDAALGRLIGQNLNGIAPTSESVQSLWGITPPGGPYDLLHSTTLAHDSNFFELSADGSRAIAAYKEKDLDPAHPVNALRFHLYDVSEGEGHAHLLDLMPGGDAPSCGVASFDPNEGSSEGIFGYFGRDLGHRGWLSADGERAIFPSRGEKCTETNPVELYAREIPSAQTKQISPPPLSGPACSAAFIRAGADAAFFWTQSRLTEADAAPPEGTSCTGKSPGTSGGDVYRYDFASEALRCLTCVVPGGGPADVRTFGEESALQGIGVSEDGSALYFSSQRPLVEGAEEGIYRVDVGCATGEAACPAEGPLAYVAPGGAAPGDRLGSSSAISADGSALVFRSADPRLDAQGGTANGGADQYYLYRQSDRSLACVSCPPDGSSPRGPVLGLPAFGTGFLSSPNTYNGSPLAADGGVFAFDTPSALVAADRNTAAPGEDPEHGQDVYEWRGGRAILVSDGQQSWPGGSGSDVNAAPYPAAVSADGRDVFFTAAAQYTLDAPDPYRRLYDARIGGGFAFPAAPVICDLDSGACEGPASAAPRQPGAGSAAFQGPGNPPARRGCPKGRRKVRRHGRTRCLKRHHHRAHAKGEGRSRR